MKKIVFFVPVAILIVPSFAFASWWNPFTWFDHSNVPVSTIQSIDNEATGTVAEENVKETTLQIPVPYSSLSTSSKQLIKNVTKDVAVKNNVSGLRDFITQYYKSDSNPCTNKYVLDSIKTSNVTCKSNANSYAVSQSLISTSSASWCAESTGFTNQGVVVYGGNK